MVVLSNRFENLDEEAKSLKKQLAIIIRKIAISFWREDDWTTNAEKAFLGIIDFCYLINILIDCYVPVL